MKCDGLIFDVDGTIWDSTVTVESAWNAALEETGYAERVTASQLKGLFGLPMLDIVDRIVNDPDTKKKEALLKKLTVYEFEYLGKFGAPSYDGLENALSHLSDKIPLAVVSNCQAGYIELMFEKTGLGKYFDMHYCPDDTGLLKAGNIKKVVRELGLKAPVYVGDTSMDEKACREAGVPFVFAAYGFGNAEDPAAIIERPEDMIGLFVE
jgi:phosphoglycolate phosphatase